MSMKWTYCYNYRQGRVNMDTSVKLRGKKLDSKLNNKLN